VTQLEFIKPDWPAAAHIVALSSCRRGGMSTDGYSSLNLAYHVGDNSQHVAENRARLLRHCPGLDAIQWLDQVHGTQVIAAQTLLPDQPPQADACYTDHYGIACAVMTADCLPVLLCDLDGQQVAAVHAGWRGLLAGILENTVREFNVSAENILVWLGPAISQSHFEVGAEVRQAFLSAAPADQQAITAQAFIPNPQNANHYFADLYQLARLRLQRMAVKRIYGGDYCTYREHERFFSYRRNGETGRMATLIYKRR
jgi:YfiH family protein